MTASLEVARKVLICVVESNAKHRNDIARALMSFYRVEVFEDGHKALDVMTQTPPAALVMDQDLPSINGETLLDKVRKTGTMARMPVILTAQRGSEPSSVPDMCSILSKPFKRSVLLNTISHEVNAGVEKAWEEIEPVQKAALKNTVAQFNQISDMIDEGTPVPYEDVKESCAPLVEAVSNNNYKQILSGVRGHDNYSYVHSLRVATLLSLFGNTIGIKGDDLSTLASGGLLHDVGKMQIPHDVLNKPGKLEGDEWATMQSHVTRTLEFLALNPDLPKGVITIAAQHHEKLNGKGYPNGIKGKELNELARMASIVDIFGALMDRRVYKDPMPPEKALSIMTEMTDELDQHFLMMFRAMLLDAASDVDMT